MNFPATIIDDVRKATRDGGWFTVCPMNTPTDHVRTLDYLVRAGYLVEVAGDIPLGTLAYTRSFRRGPRWFDYNEDDPHPWVDKVC